MKSIIVILTYQKIIYVNITVKYIEQVKINISIQNLEYKFTTNDY